MGFCLHKDDAQRFRRALKDGTVDPAKLIEMSSDERRTFFKDVVGETNAQDVNALFESKLLLKNQQQGLINWAKKVGGMTPRVQRNVLSRIEKLDKVLSAKEEKTFLKDLASQKLGLGIDFEEAQKITELTQKVKETQSAMAEGGDRLDYGRAQMALNNYVNDLKLAETKTPLKESLQHPGRTLMRGIVAAPGFTKSIQAAFDNSALFRQGWKTLFSNPVIWQRNARKSFMDIARTIGGNKTVHDETQADIISRPNYDKYKEAGLDVGNTEEAFPTHLPEKIPGIGRLYKASEVAYTNFLHKTRADVFDKMLDVADKTGVDLNPNELKKIGRLVNSLTGRGDLGHAERALSAVNNVFFSPRNFKAQIDSFTQPLTGGASIREMAEGDTGSNFVRKQAVYNLAKQVAGVAAILAIAKFLKPDAVETDPRSADFGKIKVGNTRFDVTGGAGSMLVLAARLASGQSKSSTSGKMSDLSKPAFGQPTRMDTLIRYGENKLSPIASVGKEFLTGETFGGKQPTVPGEALGLVTPLPVKTFVELLQDPVASQDPKFIALAQTMDFLGLNVNTYQKQTPNSRKQKDLDLEPLIEKTKNLLK